ncbi:AtpZ/AtpI family protein [Leptospira wolffii]|uniref:ATPase F0F1 n=1 Tax=Leptospira wolffii TaxID=409998 RepID=A0A2M9Z850_9LEPT|nr:AtpZ/AtpI family protein [Leptospira wolffii]EPG67706.1 putative F0F1-ATPase subunit [Leptospira wolffii serovar Khorat str. Khorat-H2]PJZ64609.1 ATPase F0F1 [Leptospira wolffii]TGK55144.1 AtpZ/AtpI family protein [Leptospira wolffii]TGK70555.1 AtpZ/AtpI family protein [Leptospira wolffii]TGK77597.1 AtpZ/AtpI family protein [Leptospira wolffii]
MNSSDPQPPKKDASLWQFASIGTEFGFIIVASVLVGKYLDDRFGWSPVAVLSGVALGFGYGIYYILYRLSQFDKKD